MRIHNGMAGSAGQLTRGALAIGNFDGVHLGHRGLFDAAKVSARASGGPVCALTAFKTASCASTSAPGIIIDQRFIASLLLLPLIAGLASCLASKF